MFIGIGVLFAGATLLTACLAVVFWLPRRRVSVRWAGGEIGDIPDTDRPMRLRFSLENADLYAFWIGA